MGSKHMAKNTNSASRVYSIISKAALNTEKGTAVEVWSKVFNIEETNSTKRAYKVSERLTWLYQELELIQTQMRELGFTDELCRPPLVKIHQAISTIYLNSNWDVPKRYLSEGPSMALVFCSEILPDEESQINQSDLKEIQTLVNELVELLKASTLPESLKSIIQNHIELIDQALQRYSIAGAKAFHEAVQSAVGELVLINKEPFQENKETKEIRKKAYALWAKIDTAVGFVDRVHKVSNYCQRALEFFDTIK